MFFASEKRYEQMLYKRSGKSGLNLPLLSLGLWHNFGYLDTIYNGKNLLYKAFDLGITHFDLANNYGPPPGSAEENFGKILQSGLGAYRDELVISTKAGYLMWEGPYGNWGSRKHLISSIDQSLKRMKIDYVDIFYHHRPDADTPLEETMGALVDIVKQGKALYLGLSNYKPQQLIEANEILKSYNVPCIIHQPKYSMFERSIEPELLETLDQLGIGCIAFSPLFQGLLTNKYLGGIESGSRASKAHGFLKPEYITEDRLEKVKQLNKIALQRGQSLAQMALKWVMKDARLTSVLIGVSTIEQLNDCAGYISGKDFDNEELEKIEKILNNNPKQN
ncbi:MAG: L-glyceraldehyde 3-phosphate reductase [Cytophagales bacterium]|nr:MAG: L-glyceraldehyde 3-phosphate reductase [Cytophagales bacterium]